MTPTQRRLLGRTLKTIAAHLAHGRIPDAELAPHVAKAKPGLDALFAEICPLDLTPWDWAAERIAKAANEIEAVTKRHDLYPKRPPEPRGFEGFLNGGRSWGLDCSLPVGDRA